MGFAVEHGSRYGDVIGYNLNQQEKHIIYIYTDWGCQKFVGPSEMGLLLMRWLAQSAPRKDSK